MPPVRRLINRLRFSNLLYLSQKLLHIVLIPFKRWIAEIWGTDLSDSQFIKSLRGEFSELDYFFENFATRQQQKFFINVQSSEDIISSLRYACPGMESLIIRAADQVCEHEFDLLGSGPINLGWPIDWHSDFKSGFRWNPQQYYADIRPAPYPGDYDLKVPWELSRCQHFAWLGQAYWLTGDEKYAHEFRSEVDDWIQQNPPEFGVNWACSMDTAIRAVNWLWGYAFFQFSPALDKQFWLSFRKSLLCHGRHIMANLERTARFAGNHYLSDLVGLVYLGILLPELREAHRWRDFGLKELESEMSNQVFPDGGNFEASTSYHRLATELFLSATLLARLNGHSFTQKYMERLERMLELIYQITKPDGTAPIIGDQDNGRLHRLKVWANPDHEWKDFRSLLAIGCILFERPEWGRAAKEHWEEAIWFYGGQSLKAFDNGSRFPQPQPRSTGFKDTGIYVMRADDIYIVVDIGSIGQNGRGGHAHNDSLSFELFSTGQTWIQDPGTYLYTQDYKARNLFRSTTYHNTLTLPGYEQNGFDDIALFSLKEESVTRILSWHADPNIGARLDGEVRYLRQSGLVHRRSFYLSSADRALLLTDQVEGKPPPLCQVMFHFAPGLEFKTVKDPYNGLQITNQDGKVAWLFSISTGKVSTNLQEGWISESYGVRVPSKMAVIEIPTGQIQKTVILLPGNFDMVSRIENIIKGESRYN
jgi:uncharacterized heparinase superfamily protein